MPDDIASITATSITLPISGKDYEFGFFNTYDKAEFIRAYRRHKKELIAENMRIAGAAPEHIADELDVFDEDPPTDWHKWLNQRDDEAMIEMCRISLRKKYPAEAESLILKIDFDADAFTRLIKALFGKWLSFSAPEPPANQDATYGDGGPPPNAQAPVVTYQPGTTTPTNV